MATGAPETTTRIEDKKDGGWYDHHRNSLKVQLKLRGGRRVSSQETGKDGFALPVVGKGRQKVGVEHGGIGLGLGGNEGDNGLLCYFCHANGFLRGQVGGVEKDGGRAVEWWYWGGDSGGKGNVEEKE